MRRSDPPAPGLRMREPASRFRARVRARVRVRVRVRVRASGRSKDARASLRAAAREGLAGDEKEGGRERSPPPLDPSDPARDPISLQTTRSI